MRDGENRAGKVLIPAIWKFRFIHFIKNELYLKLTSQCNQCRLTYEEIQH